MINAEVELLFLDGVTEASYNNSTRMLTGSKIKIRNFFNGTDPLIGDILIDTQVASIWRIAQSPVKKSLIEYDLPSLYLLNVNDFTTDELLMGANRLYSKGTYGHALVTPIDNKLSTNWSTYLEASAVRIALQYNAAQGGVKVIKDTSDTIIKSENKIILDLTGFGVSTPGNPSLDLKLPDYTHLNAGHTIEFFDAAALFDTKNVNISPASTQKINRILDPILIVDVTYSTIKFIYSGDSTIGWIF